MDIKRIIDCKNVGINFNSNVRGLIPYTKEWPSVYNGSNEPCDMLDGPCGCGAYHSLKEWYKKFEEHFYMEMFK